MRNFAAALVLAGLPFLAGCRYISFEKPPTMDEIALKQEVRSYYDQVGAAFAAANPETLAGLYTSSITHPMTQDQIRAWGQKFFAENGPAHFKLIKIEFDELSYIRAVVTLTYAVETKGARGDFSGVEQDTLVRHQGRWFVSSWEKLR